MNDTRARFEEIWPVPKGVCWCVVDGGYFAESTEHIPNSIRHNARLDTFTRCQETTAFKLPDRKVYEFSSYDETSEEGVRQWNACIDKFMEINK